MKENVLIVPMQPTPNGRMHIGHGAGTYLRSDVLARSLRVRGHNVSIISGSDAFENWVLAEAKFSGMTADETCDYYHSEILRDLSNLNIQFDEWIDPRSDEHYEGYLEVHEKTLKCLEREGAASLESELVPYSVETGKAMMGTWISGECPECMKPCGGSSCIYCGAHFQPEQIINPKSRLDNSTLEWKSVESWFARPLAPGQVIGDLRKSGVREVWLEAVQRYLDSSKGRIRLSGPGVWGMKSNLVEADSVLSNPYYLYSIYCGEVYKLRKGLAVNPFHPNSGVITVGVFGSDNSTPGLVVPHVVSQGSGGTYKPFDSTIINGMLFLEGQKCSTSKRHGIWLTELLESDAGINSDELRYFLSNIPLDKGVSDITLESMISTISKFREWVLNQLLPTTREIIESSTIIKYSDKISMALEEQSNFLQPNKLDLPSAISCLDRWMYETNIDKGNWLLGIALLGEPFIPTLSKQIWNMLGLKNNPQIEGLESLEIKPNESNQFNYSIGPDLSVEALEPYIHLAEVHA